MTDLPSFDRASWLGVLATAPHDRLLKLAADAGVDTGHRVLRAPEIGTVMLRGRIGGTGAPFNLGEMTVTRASVQLVDADGQSGAVGHGHVQGRSHAAALMAALVDAQLQTPRAMALTASILRPLASERQTRRESRATRAAATKVDFFTLVRGED